MNLKQLEVFVAVAETKSFTRGADRTFLTQSTVSQHISALEEEVGVKLLDRTGKGALLTEAGKIFLEHASRVLAGVDEASAAMQRYKGLEQVVLRIGGSNIPGIYLLPRFLPLFQDIHPQVSVHLIQGDSRQVLDNLRDEIIEIGFLGRMFSDDAFQFSELGTDEIILVVAGGHEWSKKGTVAIEDLKKGSFVFREEGSGTQGAVSTALAAAGVDISTLTVKARVGSNEAVKQAVQHGVGAAFVSRLSIREDPYDRGEIVPVKVMGMSISRKFYMVARSGRELSPAATAFRTGIMQWFADRKRASD